MTGRVDDGQQQIGCCRIGHSASKGSDEEREGGEEGRRGGRKAGGRERASRRAQLDGWWCSNCNRAVHLTPTAPPAAACYG